MAMAVLRRLAAALMRRGGGGVSGAKRQDHAQNHEFFNRQMQAATSLNNGFGTAPELPRVSEYHPTVGCRDASSLLCSTGLRKCNRINQLWSQGPPGSPQATLPGPENSSKTARKRFRRSIFKPAMLRRK